MLAHSIIIWIHSRSKEFTIYLKDQDEIGKNSSAIECKLDSSFLINYYEHLPAPSDLIYSDLTISLAAHEQGDYLQPGLSYVSAWKQLSANVWRNNQLFWWNQMFSMAG